MGAAKNCNLAAESIAFIIQYRDLDKFLPSNPLNKINALNTSTVKNSYCRKFYSDNSEKLSI